MEKKMQQYPQRKGPRLAAPSPPPGFPFPSMPGGSVSHRQNGHCSSPTPWASPGKVRMSDPLSYPIPQYDPLGSKAKPVINIDDGDDSRTQTCLPWTPGEDLRLVNTWLKSSNDPTNRTKTYQYWGPIASAYNSNTPTERWREVKHLKYRFQKITRWVWLFCNSFKKASSENSNGKLEVDLRNAALKYYLDDYNEGPFTVMHCWKALRAEPKWHAIMEELEKSSKRKLGDDGDEGSSTSASEDTRENECPLQKKATKKHCSVKGMVGAEHASILEDMKKYKKNQAEDRKRHEEFMEVQRRLSDAKVEAAKLKRETAMLKTYRSLMTMDTREMSDEMEAEHILGLKILRAKLFGDTS